MRFNPRIRSLGLAAALGVGGCYAYVEPSPGSLVGRPVQATLTDSGAVVLAARIGPAVEFLRGSVVSEDARKISLSVDEAEHRDGTGTSWKHEVVDVPRPLVSQVDVRQFSPTRTALFATLASVVFITVERGFLKGGGANASGTSQTGVPVGR
ncbi:MAG TPA: hypothetical protein VKP00_17725 [Gemmatimonadaceae bacterium]|nr:hypothetical protein [Gemmatimonadaceae bacterium]